MANLANALYYTNPELFGIGQKFELDPSVIKSKVSEFTGEKPGSVPIMVLSSIHLAKQRLHTMPKMVHHKVPINLGSVEQTAITLLTGNLAPRATTNNNNNNKNNDNKEQLKIW